MENISKKNKCTGCNACVTGCPKKAVSLVPDECGYFYPYINKTLCVDCGICRTICPSVTYQELRYPLDNLAAAIPSDKELLSCASGGVATIISRTIIENGGVVYGCDGTDIRNVRHRRISSLDEVDALKGSKYVQSFIGNAYSEIKSDLKTGRMVLFVGTPCQVAGLKGYLQKNYSENLFTADLVCHGVPSQKMLNDNISDYLEDKSKAFEVSFRKKIKKTSQNNVEYHITYGWFIHNHLDVGKNVEVVPFYKDPYMLGFISGLTIRPNCYECRYACIARCSDITLSDYWGCPPEAGFDKGKGVSNVLINTEQGKRLWELSKDKLIFQQRDIIEALCGNGQLQVPSARHSQHEKFAELYPQIGFTKAVLKCSRKYMIRYYINKSISTIRKMLCY